jgi:hypothetical protein
MDYCAQVFFRICLCVLFNKIQDVDRKTDMQSEGDLCKSSDEDDGDDVARDSIPRMAYCREVTLVNG